MFGAVRSALAGGAHPLPPAQEPRNPERALFEGTGPYKHLPVCDSEHFDGVERALDWAEALEVWDELPVDLLDAFGFHVARHVTYQLRAAGEDDFSELCDVVRVTWDRTSLACWLFSGHRSDVLSRSVRTSKRIAAWTNAPENLPVVLDRASKAQAEARWYVLGACGRSVRRHAAHTLHERDGLGGTAIAQRLGCSPATISRDLSVTGVTLRPYQRWTGPELDIIDSALDNPHRTETDRALAEVLAAHFERPYSAVLRQIRLRKSRARAREGRARATMSRDAA